LLASRNGHHHGIGILLVAGTAVPTGLAKGKLKGIIICIH
jgi:hypothetical protein